MLAISIIFQFGIDSEVRRVDETLKNMAWLTKNNYRFSLPNSIKDSEDLNIGEIRKSIETEYDPRFYQIAEDAIIKSWEKNNEIIKRINQKLSGSSTLNEIVVILTRYGTQGSYTIPNSMTINIATGIPSEFLIKTVVHESIHLMIEDLIKKYKIDHWVKERIVNLIVDVEYKSRFKMNPVPDWVHAVDSVFREHYPDLISLIENAARIRPVM